MEVICKNATYLDEKWSISVLYAEDDPVSADR